MSNLAMVNRLLAFVQTVTEEDLAMSAEELLCFLTVAVKPGLSVGELVEETGLPQSTVSRHLRRLSGGRFRSKGGLGPLSWELEVERGQDLLEQRVNPELPRQKALHVTATGEALLKRFEQSMNGG